MSGGPMSEVTTGDPVCSAEHGRVGAIWAQDASGLLGADGAMLWRVPADFRHFKAATLGGALVMGRVTWESLAGALTGRRNIVLTHRQGWGAPGALGAETLPAALDRAHAALAGMGPDPREGRYRRLPRVWVIGGGSVYAQALRSGVLDELVVSSLDLDARERAEAAGIGAELLVAAPSIDPAAWELDAQAGDPPGTWRPVSGDAAWRVDHWLRRRAAR